MDIEQTFSVWCARFSVRRDEAVGVTGSGLGAASERGPAEGEDRPAIAQETTMTLQWMADPLKMGTWTHVTNWLYHLKK